MWKLTLGYGMLSSIIGKRWKTREAILEYEMPTRAGHFSCENTAPHLLQKKTWIRLPANTLGDFCRCLNWQETLEFNIPFLSFFPPESCFSSNKFCGFFDQKTLLKFWEKSTKFLIKKILIEV